MYINAKKENGKFLRESILNGPYVMKEIDASTITPDKPGKVICDDQEDSLTTTMMLLARAITQRYSTPTNNCLCTSLNTRNQAIVQANHVDIQSKNVGNSGWYVRRTTGNQGDVAGNVNIQINNGNDTNVWRIPRTTANSGNGPNVQCYNCNAKDVAGIILDDEQNDFLLADAFEVEEFEYLNATVCMMALIQQEGSDSDNRSIYDSNFIGEVNDGQVEQDNNDHDQRHVEIESLIKNVQIEAEKQRMISKESEDTYLDDILDLEGKIKAKKNMVDKMSHSLQAIYMLGPKPKSFYDQSLKNGLCYKNPYTLKQEIGQKPKLYDASSLCDLKMHVDICDTEEILDDAEKSRFKMKRKLNDPIAIEKKVNFVPIDSVKLNKLSKTFVPQVELSLEQQYFS
ncbi:hypothetical protein Tco_1378241 [Tanacetum coccineum]